MEPLVVKAAETHIYSINRDGNKFNLVSYLRPDHVMKHGIPQEGVIGALPASVTDILDASFRANPAFVKLLHGVIAEYGPQMPGLQETVRQTSSGFVQVVDGRAPEPRSEAEQEDILGEFEVKDGRVVEGSYTANPGHQVVGRRGLLILDPWLHERLMERLNGLVSKG